eukprot:COSAG02_NODE_419_length_22613_cov_22.994492_16_plen_171_part_00
MPRARQTHTQGMQALCLCLSPRFSLCLCVCVLTWSRKLPSTSFHVALISLLLKSSTSSSSCSIAFGAIPASSLRRSTTLPATTDACHPSQLHVVQKSAATRARARVHAYTLTIYIRYVHASVARGVRRAPCSSCSIAGGSAPFFACTRTRRRGPFNSQAGLGSRGITRTH